MKIDAKEFEAKFPTKRDVWRVLTHECGYYLPAEPTVTAWFCKELMRGERTRIKRSEHVSIHIPQYDSLAIEDIMDYAKGKPEVMCCMPSVEIEILKLPRE